MYVVCVAFGWKRTICRCSPWPGSRIASSCRRHESETRSRQLSGWPPVASFSMINVVSPAAGASVGSSIPLRRAVAAAATSRTMPSKFSARETSRLSCGGARTGGANGHSRWPITMRSSQRRVARSLLAHIFTIGWKRKGERCERTVRSSENASVTFVLLQRLPDVELTVVAGEGA